MALGALIVLLGLVLAVIAVLVLLFDSRTRPWAAGALALGLPIGILSIFYLRQQSTSVASAAWPQNTAFHSPTPIHTTIDIAPAAVAVMTFVALVAFLYLLFAADQSWVRQHLGKAGGWALVVIGVVLVAILLPPKPSSEHAVEQAVNRLSYPQIAEIPPSQPAESTPKKTETSTAAAAQQAAPDGSEKSSRPDWMNQPAAKQGDVYIVPVSSGVYSDPAVRDQMLDVKTLAAANRYIDEILYRQSGVAEAVALDPDSIQNYIRARTASAANDETFVRLELNQKFRDEVDRRYKQFVSLNRLEQLGVIALAGFGALGAIYSLLRLTQPSKSSTRSVQAPA